MVTLSMRNTVFFAADDDLRVTGISLPDWGEVVGARLLRSITDSEVAVFNCHLLGDLLGELDHWERFEADRGDPDVRLGTIEQIRQSLAAPKKYGHYAIFGSAPAPVQGRV